jgi:putative tricarboxylic transport membrane protein
MDPILTAAWEGLRTVFSWPYVLYPIAGTLLSMVVSAMPGVSGVTLMALAIPFTASWDPLPVMLLFGSLVGGATFMGSVSAILLNIPGKNSNAATTLDGHPLAQQGQARTAIGCSAAASALGSSFGILVLILLIPVMRRAILWFGPPEFLMLVVWGLTTIAVATRGSMIKGVALAGLGFLIAFVGLDPRTAELRFTFGVPYLSDGLSLVPVFLGVFAVAETLELWLSGRATISGSTRLEELQGSLREGALAVFRHFGLFLRCSLIGTTIGMIPGVGGTVASFVAYGHAARSAGSDGRFGRGDLRGVLAPEASNDAKDAGALVPTLAFGVPGGTGTAMLLAALLLHGIVPGRELMANHLDLVFVLIWSLFLSNLITSALGAACVGSLARITVVRTQRLVPLILVLAATGALSHRGQLGDLFVAFAFGVFGYVLKRHDWSRIPFVIALVLAPAFETHLHLTVRLEELGRISFFSRPIAVGLLVLTLSSLALPRLTRRRPGARA